MSKPKCGCGNNSQDSQEIEAEPINEPVELAGGCEQARHCLHNSQVQDKRKSEVCTLEPPPERDASKMCGKKSRNVDPPDNRKMECRVIEEDRCEPQEEDCPKVVSKCGGKNGN